jgi:hypothetical protein
VRALHRHPTDGRVRLALGLSGVRHSCTARDSDSAALLDGFRLDAARPCDQREKRRRAAHLGVSQGVARRRMRLLFRESLSHDPQGKGRFQKLSRQPAVDDLALAPASAGALTSLSGRARSPGGVVGATTWICRQSPTLNEKKRHKSLEHCRIAVRLRTPALHMRLTTARSGLPTGANVLRRMACAVMAGFIFCVERPR